METYGVEEARSSLGDLVERVRIGDEHFVITRYGKPAAAIVPVEWLGAAKRERLEMGKRIVQMLVTVAADTDRGAADVQEEIGGLLAASWPSVIVELVGSRVRSHAGSATSDREKK